MATGKPITHAVWGSGVLRSSRRDGARLAQRPEAAMIAAPSQTEAINMLSVIDGVEALTTGPLHWFEQWPTGGVPRTGAVVYTIWDREGQFIYVGMSGRGYQEGVTKPGSDGPWGRLSSHASGRRSGDQFCVY